MNNMHKNLLYPALFIAGLLATVWIGIGYIASNPLALAVVLLIGACYLAGAFELHRYRQATATLTHALGELSAPPSALDVWLERLHPSLRNPARLRIEGERGAMPAPALAPYLVGLLVLLGMLGTLLGMMTTLRGTGAALESAMDLAAMRESLAAPVKGLAFAFGTSIVGVATSAMLGLLSALCKRERADAVQRLDTAIATTLRTHSQAHRREEAFKLLQRQVELMPTLVDRLQTMMATIEQQQADANQRLESRQQTFHDQAGAAYAQLAASMETSLKDSVRESARAASAVLQPAVEATMASVADKTASLHDTLSRAVQQQLDGLSSGFEATTTTVAGLWSDAIATQRQSNTTLNDELRGTLAQFVDAFGQRASDMVDTVSSRFDVTSTQAREAWTSAVAQQQTLNDELRGTLTQFVDTFEQRATGLVDTVATRFDATSTQAGDAWTAAMAQQQALNDALAERNQQALSTATAAFEANATSLLGTLQQSHVELQDALQSRDEQRLAAWADRFAALTGTLDQRWQQAGEATIARQQAICDTLARTADDIAAQTQAHAAQTIAEISRLVQTASEAPKAAADVIAELRQKLSDSMVHDNAMLEERGRLLQTLQTLLDAVNHASTEQRASVDALIGTSADLLERVGNRFAAQVEAEAGKLVAVASQIVAGTVDVASVGDAFAVAVQQFGESNQQLVERLQVVEVALDKSLARSDEQLAYYVAQAREVVDLSMLAQKQILDDLKRLGDHRAAQAETA